MMAWKKIKLNILLNSYKLQYIFLGSPICAALVW